MNHPPNITGPATFNVTVGQQSSFEITVTDTNLANFTIVNGELGELVRDENDVSQYTFILTPTQSLDRTILFLATDDMSASTQYEPRIEFCSCQNGGMCTLNGLLDQTANPVDLNCICTNPGKTCFLQPHGSHTKSMELLNSL